MSRELLKKISQQLEAFIEGNYWPNTHILLDEIKAELAKPEPEPVAYLTIDNAGKEHAHLGKMSDSTLKDWNIKQQLPLYTHPPTQQKSLSDDEIQEMIGIPKDYKAFYEVVKAVEAHHGIK